MIAVTCKWCYLLLNLIKCQCRLVLGEVLLPVIFINFLSSENSNTREEELLKLTVGQQSAHSQPTDYQHWSKRWLTNGQQMVNRFVWELLFFTIIRNFRTLIARSLHSFPCFNFTINNVWLALWVGKVNWILCCDWLTKSARSRHFASLGLPTVSHKIIVTFSI